jgi:sulfate transport system ATP-binding protein
MAVSRGASRFQTPARGMTGAPIEIKNVSRSFGQHAVLKDVSLAVYPGELLALLGPSGSGKTTLLRLIAGLDVPDAGSIVLDQMDARSANPRDRNVGFVFQHYALFRHMTVFENIAFAMRVRRAPKREVNARVGELLQLIQLESLADRYPAQLSGGQRQRVALARSLAIRPRVLLLDEPFGALDAVVRRDLRRWLRKLHEEMNITTVFVTHDQEEAFELADRVVIMSAGQIRQDGTPMSIYEEPADAFVHEFLGESNGFPCTVRAGTAVTKSGVMLGRTDAPDGDYVGYVRPEQISIHPERQGAWRINRIAITGARSKVFLSRGDEIVEAALSADNVLTAGLKPDMMTDLSWSRGTLYGGARPFKLLNTDVLEAHQKLGRLA